MTGLKDVLNAITAELLHYKGSFRNSLVRPLKDAPLMAAAPRSGCLLHLIDRVWRWQEQIDFIRTRLAQAQVKRMRNNRSISRTAEATEVQPERPISCSQEVSTKGCCAQCGTQFTKGHVTKHRQLYCDYCYGNQKLYFQRALDTSKKPDGRERLNVPSLRPPCIALQKRMH